MTSGTMIRLEDSAGPWLERLARRFPRELDRALGRVGWWLRDRTQWAMRSGGHTIGQSWQERSLIASYRPFERMRRDMWKSGKSQKMAARRMRRKESLATALTKASPLVRGRPNLNARGFGSGRLIGAVRYRVDRARHSVSVGFLGGSAASTAWSLMAGRRGKKHAFEFRGPQPVTDRMRRMFWAAGVPIAKETTMLGQTERPLIQPVFDRYRAEAMKRLELQIEAYALRLSRDSAASYVTRHL